MTDDGTVQGNELEVTDEDVRAEKPAPKADKQQAKSQPPGKESGAKDKGPGPWQAKLAEMGLEDPRFDEFMRSEVQPYITQLEQGGGGESSPLWNGDSELEQAAYQMIDQLRNDPVQAFYELGELLGLIDGEGNVDDGSGYDDSEFEGDDFGDEPEDPRLQYVNDLMRKEQEQQEDAEYDAFLTAIGERLPGFDPDLYTQIFLANQGDLDASWDSYMRYHRDPEPPPNSPPTLGEDGVTPPRSGPEYNGIGDAIDGFLSDLRASKGR